MGLELAIDPAVELEHGPVAVAVELVQVPAERERGPVAAELELVPVVAELELVPVVVELELVPVVAALRTRSVIAAHHRGLVPALRVEDSAAVAETTLEPVAAEAVIAWAAAE